jgi:two-component sensor histidine kinase
LIINEFITNSLKYAFPEAKDGQIAISMCKIEDSCHAEEQAKSQTSDHNSKIELIFHDNGIGIPEDVDIEQAKTMGMSLIRGLTQQLSSTIELDRSNGTEFKIIFKV